MLCFDGSVLYRAKVLKCLLEEKGAFYNVRYYGRNKSPQQWVPETRVLKCNEENLKRLKETRVSNQRRKRAIVVESSGGAVNPLIADTHYEDTDAASIEGARSFNSVALNSSN